MGITLYFMYFKKYPFIASNIPTLYKKILNEEPEYPSDANPKMVALLKMMFMKDPGERATLLQVIQHDWVNCNGMQPIRLINAQEVISLSNQETEGAIKKVNLIANIRLKLS